MADPTPRDSQIFKVSEVPLWYRSMQVAGLATLLGLGIAFGFIYSNYIQAQAVAEIFRQSRKPILQYRLEKGVWPTNFTFDKIPPDLEAYEFSAAVRGFADAGLKGVWQFAQLDVNGNVVPKVIFKSEDLSLNARRILFGVDAQLDDGKDASGRLLVVASQAEFTLMGE
jgi:hypothetical protein